MADKSLLYQAQILTRQARQCIVRQEYSAAETLYQQVLQYQKQALGSKHMDVAQTLLSMSMLFRKQARYSDAYAYCQQSVSLQEQVLGLEHLDTIVGMRFLALLRKDQKRFAEAEDMYQKMLLRNRDEQEANNIMSDIACLYLESGRYARAEGLFKLVLSNRRSTLHQGHTNILATLRHLALTHFKQGQYAEAEPLFREVLEYRRKKPVDMCAEEHLIIAIFGDQPDLIQKREQEGKLVIAGLLHDLACVCKCMGRYEDAETLLRETINLRRDALGAEHAQTQQDVKMLTELLQSQRLKKTNRPE